MGMENSLPIESLLNLGPKSGQWLRDAGITTIADLERLGPVVAYRLVKQRQPKASLNLLWALAAGLKGKDWRELSEATKRRLRREAEEE
jgi:DNA transformation protein